RQREQQRLHAEGQVAVTEQGQGGALRQLRARHGVQAQQKNHGERHRSQEVDQEAHRGVLLQNLGLRQLFDRQRRRRRQERSPSPRVAGPALAARRSTPL